METDVCNGTRPSLARLEDAEWGIQEEIPTEQARTIRSYVLGTRAGIANLSGETMHGVSLARLALDLLPEAALDLRTGALVTTAHAYLASGNVTPESEREVAAADAFLHMAGHLLAAERSRTLLGRLYVLQGRRSQGQRGSRAYSAASSTISPWVTCCASGRAGWS